MPLAANEKEFLDAALSAKPEEIDSLSDENKAELDRILKAAETDERVEGVWSLGGKPASPQNGDRIRSDAAQEIGVHDRAGPLPEGPSIGDIGMAFGQAAGEVAHASGVAAEHVGDFVAGALKAFSSLSGAETGSAFALESVPALKESTDKLNRNVGAVISAPIAIPKFVQDAISSPEEAGKALIAWPSIKKVKEAWDKDGPSAALAVSMEESPIFIATAFGARAGVKGAARVAEKGISAAADLTRFDRTNDYFHRVADVEARAAGIVDGAERSRFVAESIERIGDEIGAPVLRELGKEMGREARGPVIGPEKTKPFRQRDKTPEAKPVNREALDLITKRGDLEKLLVSINRHVDKVSDAARPGAPNSKAARAELDNWALPKLREIQKAIDDIDTQLSTMRPRDIEIAERATVDPVESATRVAETQGPVTETQRSVVSRGTSLEDVSNAIAKEIGAGEKRRGEAAFVRIAGEGGEPTRPGRVDPSDAVSTNPKIEAFYKETAELKPDVVGVLGRVKDAINERFKTFAELKKDPVRFNYAVEKLRQMGAGELISAESSARDIANIIKTLPEGGLELWRRYLVARDMHYVASHPETYPGGVPRDLAPRQMVAEVVSEGFPLFPELTKNVERQRVNVAGLTQELKSLREKVAKYQEIQKAIEFTDRLMGVTRNELVARGLLDEAVLKNDSYIPHYVLYHINQMSRKGFSRQRLGSAHDYYTDMTEVLFRHFTDTRNAMRTYDLATQIMRRYDQSAATMAKGLNLKPGERVELDGKPYIARSSTFGYRQSQVGSATMTHIQNLIESLNVDEMFPGVNRQAIEQMLDRGGKSQVFVIPEELNRALDKALEAKGPQGLLAAPTAYWKALAINANPIRYNVRNLLGDIERVFAFEPRILADRKGMAAAIREYVDYKRKDILSEDIAAALQRDVMQSGRTTAETLGNAKRLDRIAEALDRSSDFSAKGLYRVIRNGLASPRKFAEFREGLLRYVSFKQNLNAMRAGKAPMEGISDIRGINNRFDIAAKVSREILGDYNDFTVFEQRHLREAMIPFYSWLKINSAAWPAAIAKRGPEAMMRFGAVKGTASAALFATRSLAAYYALNQWNRQMYPAEEQTLPEWKRRRPHLLVQTKDGVKYIGHPTALVDFLDNFGLQEAGSNVEDLWEGRLNLREAAAKTFLDVVGDTSQTLAQSASPLAKVPLEVAGVKTFPRFGFKPPVGTPTEMLAQMAKNVIPGLTTTEPRQIVEEARARGASGAVVGYLERGFGLSDVDRLRNAEGYMHSLFDEFMAKKGISVNVSSQESKAKSDIVSALDSEDRDGFVRGMSHAREIGIEPYKIYEYIRSRPISLADVPIKHRSEFIGSLNEWEREIFKDSSALIKRRLNRALEYGKAAPNR